MRGYVCAQTGTLPNDPMFREMSDAELVFLHYYLRKKAMEDKVFWLDEGPRIIGRAVGTYWTYNAASAAAGGGGPDTCSSCGSQDKTISNEGGSMSLVCLECGAPWDVEKAQAGSKPSAANFPLAMMIAIAMRAKNASDMLKFIKDNLGPNDNADPDKGTPSDTVRGATMMDARHSTAEEFREIVRKAQKEVGLVPNLDHLDEVFDQVDARSGGVVRDRTDHKGEDTGSESDT